MSGALPSRRPFARDRAMGRRLRAARKAAAMSLDDLAAESGWSASLLGYMERGERAVNPRVLRDVEMVIGLPSGSLGWAEYRATRVGPHVVGSAYLSGWTWEEVAA